MYNLNKSKEYNYDYLKCVAATAYAVDLRDIKE